MNLPPTAALPAFVLGLVLLAALANGYRALARLRRASEERWQAVETALTRRGEGVATVAQQARRVPGLSGLAGQLRDSLEDATAARERGERIAAEQAISRLLDALSTEAEAAGVRESSGEHLDLAELLLEMQVREQQIAEARERYNETAAAWNTHRAAFPTGLLARSLAPEPVPLFDGGGSRN